MDAKTVNISDAKKRFSRLLARVAGGERVVIARAGKPVAELQPLRRPKRRSITLEDPLLRVDEYSYDGPIGPTTNRAIDSTVNG